jgi:F-type H+-transporting ATPase subunit b
MESIISDFHIDWRMLLAQLFNFGVVVAILYFFAFKPIVKMMAERTNKIDQGLKDAESSRVKLEVAEADAQVLMKEANKQGDAVVAEAGRKAAAVSAVAVSEAQAKAAVIIEQGKHKVEQDRERVSAELKQEGAALAVALAEKILSQKMDAAADDNFINKITK